MSKLSVLLRNAILSSVVIISFAVTAQEIEEVVVTATKKEESVQDLALSIEAVNAESLDVNQVYDVSDLAEITPGLETAKTIGSGSGWTIRGMGSFGIGAGVIASVVTAVNGHSVNDSVVADTGFFDLERVEVLKGPQGTLYGRNAANGVVNLITARPTNDFGGSYNVEVGNFGAIRTQAVVNMPFSDSLRKRIKLINCDKNDIENTVKILQNQVSDSFKKNESFLKENSENIYIISSGFHELIEPIVVKYGIKKENIFANRFLYDKNNVIGYDKNNPLCKSQGKVNIMRELKLKGKIHVIGDGFTDYEIKKEGLANYFYLFIENIKRESVVKSADYLLKSLDQFIKIIRWKHFHFQNQKLKFSF